MAKKAGIPCYHCGEDCGKHSVMFDDKPFCCTGCRTVYQLLSDNDACDAILEAGKFHFLPKYLSFPTTSLGIVKVSFVISFLYNIFGIYFAVQGYLTPILSAILMPISSVSIV